MNSDTFSSASSSDSSATSGKSCFTVVVKNNEFKDQARGELLVEKDSYHIVQISVFDMYGKQTSLVKLSDFQAVEGISNKVQPRRLVAEDLKEQKVTDMRVLKVVPRTDLKEEDFQLPSAI